MRPYFETMDPLGRDLKEKELKDGEENARLIAEEENKVAEAVQKVKDAGIPAEKIHGRGEKTALERIEMLVDPGTFLPLNTLYDPCFNEEGTTGVVNGVGQIAGRYAKEQQDYEKKVADRTEKAKVTGKKPCGREPKPPTPGPQPTDQVNLTDEQSRFMPTSGGGFEQAYNA